MSTFTVSIRAEALLEKVKQGPARLHANMLRVLNRLSIEVQSAVKEQKLTGQKLHVRTGTLRRSINRVITDNASGMFATVGTNVRYAAIHEYGFEGVVNVREHVRRSKAQVEIGRSRKGKRVSKRLNAQREVGSIFVRAHTRNVDMPERSFLRSTLDEFRDRIRQQIRDAAMESIK